eukprot:360124-Chlamydomonas_euryale.AAC.1
MVLQVRVRHPWSCHAGHALPCHAGHAYGTVALYCAAYCVTKTSLIQVARPPRSPHNTHPNALKIANYVARRRARHHILNRLVE